MGLVDEALRVCDALGAESLTSDELGRLSDPAWKLLQETGVLRALQPARFGGGEVSLVEFMDAVMVLSAASPSAGWVAGVLGVHPWQLALFDDRAQQEMWADDPKRIHSSSYNPTGKAVRVEGGYRVSGRWSFSSGCDHCHGVNLGAITEGEDDSVSEYRSFLLHPDQYLIEDNWDVAGLRGTGSKDIVVESTFVPEYRSQSHLDYATGAALVGWQVNTSPLYRLPWSVVFNMALAASVLGSARGYIQAWTTEAASRRFADVLTLADDPLTQRRLADAVWPLEATVSVLRSHAIELLQRAEAGDIPTMAGRGRYRWDLNRGCELVGDAIVSLHRAASGRTIFRGHPLHRRFQDIQGGLGHAFLVPDPLARAVGGELLGAAMPEMIL